MSSVGIPTPTSTAQIVSKSNRDNSITESKGTESKGTESKGTESKGIRMIKEFIPKPGKVEQKNHTLLLVERMYEKEDSSLRGRLRKVLNSTRFDYFMGILILFNMCAMIIEIDISAGEDAENPPPHWTEKCSWIMLAIFIVELSARVLAFKYQFWQDRWNVFDFFIVLIDAVFSIVGLAAGNLFPVSILRIFRLAKLVRVSKVLRVFPELRLLIAGLMSSMSAIFWGTVLLVLCLLVCSMGAVLFIHPLNKEIDYGDSCTRCPRAYSSVMQATLTFWQQIVTGDSWGQATIPLLEAYPATIIFFIPMFLCIGMAVMNLILGVVVSVAQTAKEEIEMDDIKEFIMLQAERHTHLLGLCMQMDVDKDGVISHEEVQQAYDEPGEFRDSLLKLEITQEEIEIVWKIIDAERKGQVPYEEVVKALYAVKSSDTHFMLAYIKYYVTIMKEQLQHTIMEHSAREEVELKDEANEVREELKQVEALEFGVWQVLRDDQEHQSTSQGPSGKLGVRQECTKPCPGHVESNRNVKSAAESDRLISDEEQTWMKSICHRVAMTRSDLDGILADLRGRYEPLVSSSTAVIASITGSTAKADLQEMSDKGTAAQALPGELSNEITGGSSALCQPAIRLSMTTL